MINANVNNLISAILPWEAANKTAEDYSLRLRLHFSISCCIAETLLQNQLYMSFRHHGCFSMGDIVLLHQSRAHKVLRLLDKRTSKDIHDLTPVLQICPKTLQTVWAIEHLSFPSLLFRVSIHTLELFLADTPEGSTGTASRCLLLLRQTHQHSTIA